MAQEKQTPIQAYQKGDIVDFKVRFLFSNYCELIDEKTGISAYLQGTAKLVLIKGQSLQCRILTVSGKHPKIELVNISEFQSNDNLTEDKLKDLLASKDVSWSIKDFVKLLTEDKEKSFESQCHRWIQSLINKKINLQAVRQNCLDLLEQSELLNICSNNGRDFYQERLTLLIEQLGYYIRAAELLDNETIEGEEDTSNHFIESLFNKLRISGFVYHPNKNFSILSSLFLLQPQLLNSCMNDLLNIIKTKEIKTWEREPFNSAFIKLLELYIRESEGKFDKTKDNKEIIDNNILALVIQLLLIKDTKNTDLTIFNLNAARLCVLSSYKYPSNPARMVNLAYYNLFNSETSLPLYPNYIENVNYLPHYFSNYNIANINTINSFSQGNSRLIISDKGIQLLSTREKKTLHPVFPKELELWKDLQVFMPTKTETNLKSVKPNDINPYQHVWTEIETEFFNVTKKPVVATNKNKKQHRLDDMVKITFTGQDVNNRNKYYCQIEDEIGGNGFIYVSDIVGYSISTSLRLFYASDGSRFVFQAQIIDIENDLFHFSMLEDLNAYLSHDFYSYDEEIICSVGTAPNTHGISPAISKDGVSVSIRNADEFKGIGKNSIVRCKLLEPGSGTFHIRCEIVGLASYDFDLITAFKNLMECCSIGKIPENITQQDEDQIQESDKLIDESYVKELIYMIDRMALIDSEYVKSFNYLGFARILCLLIGWESQAAYYKGRMDIIVMLHDFAQNSKVDEEKLTQLENANSELFSNNVVLKERFMQLQIVSYIGREEHNADLFNLANYNPSLKNLASLVLAYNVTRANNMESSATNIHNKIIQLLHLKGYETGLKKYGSGEETEELEYKTSFIFHAEDSSNKPNPEKQKDEILKVINSFLNTRGGTLFIGVNNFGYGVGVEEDLNSSLYEGDKDKYVRSVVDAVANEWGNNIATTYIKRIVFDEENTEKSVLVIDILPIQTGLAYRGNWYVRTAGTKRKLTQSEYEEYKKINRKLQISPVINEKEQEQIKDTPQERNTISTPKPLISSKEDKIKTSRIRKNILAEWEDQDNYVEPIGFFKFIAGGKFRKISEYDYDEESLLTLVVKDSEGEGCLVLGYENGHIVKVPIALLLDYKN